MQQDREPISAFASDEILAFASQDEAVKWLITAYLEQRKEILRLTEENAAMAARMDLAENCMRNAECNLEIHAGILRRMRRIPNQEPKILDELYDSMVAIGRKQVDFATAAKMVKRSKSRLLQLKAEIGQDMRFVLVPAESHSQKVLIRIRQ